MPAELRRCVDLLDDHLAFDRCLVAAREAHHRRRIREREARIDALAGALRAHIDFEETVLLPRFDALEHPVPNGAPEVFRRDHRLILRLLDQLRADRSDPVAVAGHLAQLAGVLEHHDLRESRYFKPRLDEALGAAAHALVAAYEAVDPEPPEVDPTVESAPPIQAVDPLERLREAAATGQLSAASSALERLVVEPGTKAARWVARTREALSAGEAVAAWDAIRLLSASLTGRTPTG